MNSKIIEATGLTKESTVIMHVENGMITINRLRKKLGALDPATSGNIKKVLVTMFS